MTQNPDIINSIRPAYTRWRSHSRPPFSFGFSPKTKTAVKPSPLFSAQRHFWRCSPWRRASWKEKSTPTPSLKILPGMTVSFCADGLSMGLCPDLVFFVDPHHQLQHRIYENPQGTCPEPVITSVSGWRSSGPRGSPLREMSSPFISFMKSSPSSPTPWWPTTRVKKAFEAGKKYLVYLLGHLQTLFPAGHDHDLCSVRYPGLSTGGHSQGDFSGRTPTRCCSS